MFRDLVERIYVEMTARPAAAPRGPARPEHFPGTGIGTILPRVSTNLLSGLIEAVAAAPHNGQADLPVIAHSVHMEVDELFPVAETLQMLRLVEIEGGDIHLAEAGKRFADAALDERKQLFKHHLLNYVPLAGHIRRVLGPGRCAIAGVGVTDLQTQTVDGVVVPRQRGELRRPCAAFDVTRRSRCPTAGKPPALPMMAVVEKDAVNGTSEEPTALAAPRPAPGAPP